MKWHDGRVSSDPVCERNFQIAWAWPPLKKYDVDWSDQKTTTSASTSTFTLTSILRMMGPGQKAKKLPCFALFLTTCFLSGEFVFYISSIYFFTKVYTWLNYLSQNNLTLTFFVCSLKCSVGPSWFSAKESYFFNKKRWCKKNLFGLASFFLVFKYWTCKGTVKKTTLCMSFLS